MDLVWAAFRWPVQLCTFASGATYVASLITSNASQVDRLWTFLPTIYTAYFALLPLWPISKQPFFLCPYVPEEIRFAAQSYSPRSLLMLTMIVLWMFRLSYNTYRRGLFVLSSEDYRWLILRDQIPPWLFQVFNFSFVAIVQNILLLGLSYPAFLAVTQQPHNYLASSDIGLALLQLAVLLLEFTADNQQFAYQTFKHSLLHEGKPYDKNKQWPGARLNWTAEDAKRGFITKGLWAYSRHPNFACEQSFWWIVSLFPVLSPYPPQLPHYNIQEVANFFRATMVALGTSPRHLFILFDQLNYFLIQCAPLAPAAALSLLFYSSTIFTESISKSKYPTYTVYQKRVGMFSVFKTLEKGLWMRLMGDTSDRSLWGLDKGKEKEN